MRHDLTCDGCGTDFAVDAPVNPETLPDYCRALCAVENGR